MLLLTFSLCRVSPFSCSAFLYASWYSWMSLKPNLLISSPMRELEAGLGLEDSDLVGVWDLMERSSASAMSSSSSMLSPMLSSSSSSSTEPELMAATDPGLLRVRGLHDGVLCLGVSAGEGLLAGVGVLRLLGGHGQVVRGGRPASLVRAAGV